MRMKWNTNNVGKWFKQRGSELLSEYKDIRSRIKFRCSKCGGHAEYSSFDSLKKRRSDCLCSKCSEKNIGQYNRLNTVEVKNWFRERGSVLLSEYRNNRSVLKFKCSQCDSIEFSRFNNIRKTNSDCLCKKCSMEKFSKVQRQDVNIIEKWFKDRNSRLLSEYRNCFSKVKFVCSKCRGVGYYHSFRRMFEINILCLCRECSIGNRSGENNPNWNFNISEEERNNQRGMINRWYYDWRKEVLQRYNNSCIITGTKGKNIIVHHLYNWKDFPERRIFISNGVPLRKDIHKEYHSIYGYKRNTPEQFAEFVEIYYGN